MVEVNSIDWPYVSKSQYSLIFSVFAFLLLSLCSRAWRHLWMAKLLEITLFVAVVLVLYHSHSHTHLYGICNALMRSNEPNERIECKVFFGVDARHSDNFPFDNNVVVQFKFQCKNALCLSGHINARTPNLFIYMWVCVCVHPTLLYSVYVWVAFVETKLNERHTTH